MFKKFFKWRNKVIEKLDLIIGDIECIKKLDFLSLNEINNYRSGLLHLHESLSYVGNTVVIYDLDDCVVYAGVCTGYGALINNIYKDDSITCATKKFLIIQNKEENKMCTLEPGMRIQKI